MALFGSETTCGFSTFYILPRPAITLDIVFWSNKAFRLTVYYTILSGSSTCVVGGILIGLNRCLTVCRRVVCSPTHARVGGTVPVVVSCLTALFVVVRMLTLFCLTRDNPGARIHALLIAEGVCNAGTRHRTRHCVPVHP